MCIALVFVPLRVMGEFFPALFASLRKKRAVYAPSCARSSLFSVLWFDCIQDDLCHTCFYFKNKCAVFKDGIHAVPHGILTQEGGDVL